MEYNKEEAIRAKEMAKKKMESNDFVGARKLLCKAQQLYPGLESITQMLIVCEIHYSSEQKLHGSERDYYGILQVERTADEISIKKQYRKLALVLHPDKNNSPGAEAAFMLIGEAHRVLSDKSKRSMYDVKVKTSVDTPMPKKPRKKPERKSSSSKQPGVRRTPRNGSRTESTSSKAQPQSQQQQKTQPDIPIDKQSFWTMCYFCKIKYKYHNQVMGRLLHCQNCQRLYVAQNVNYQSGSPETKNHQSEFSQQKDPKVGPQNTSANTFHNMGYQGKCNGAANVTNSFPSTSSSGVGVGSKTIKIEVFGPENMGSSRVCVQSRTIKKEDFGVDMGVGKKPEEVPESMTENSSEGKASDKMNKKRGRTDESNAGNNIDIEGGEGIKENGGSNEGQSTGFTGSQFHQRYPWKKQPVTFEDVGKSDGFKNLLRRVKTGSSNATKEKSFEEPSEFETLKIKKQQTLNSFSGVDLERGNAPEGSFKFDPASYSVNLEIPRAQANWGTKDGVHSELNGSDPKSQEKQFESSNESASPSMPKTWSDLDEKIIRDSGVPKSTSVFSRESNRNHEKQPLSQATVRPCSIKEEIGKQSHISKDDGCDTLKDAGLFTFQVDVKKSSLNSVRTRLYNVTEENQSPPSSFPESEEPESIFYNFDDDRAEEKFQAGQVWALYSDEDRFPKYYGRITKVESFPKFKLHITRLEACPMPKNMLQWSNEDMPVGCGVFRFPTGERMVYTNARPFSHHLRVESSGRNKYEIYPMKGEIWAVYKDFNPKWKFSDLAKCDYDIVEVFEDDGSAIEVSLLKQVNGYKTFFRAEAGSKMSIPWVELLRFSHQVPAFLVPKERDDSLGGCWVLDPPSFPVC